MNFLIRSIKNSLILKKVYHSFKNFMIKYKNRSKNMQMIFTEIYQHNLWSSDESFSGVGSTLSATQFVVTGLNNIIDELNIESMLDIPCGDFNWMKNVNINNLKYIGADIVCQIIEDNQKKYGADNIQFIQMNLIEDKLPTVDLILCRDCLVHLSFKDIWYSLKNISETQSTYLVTTTFTDRYKNYDIATGLWRPLNLEADPFYFPRPLILIQEQKDIKDTSEFGDKCLGVWKIEDIRLSLNIGYLD